MGADLIETLLISLRVALVGTLVSALFALPTAYLLARFSFRGKWLLSALTLLPLVLPPVVTGYVLLISFGPNGPIGQFFSAIGLDFGFRWTGAALAAGLVAFPLILRPMRLALEHIDPELHDSMQADGASRWKRFLHLDLPLAMPGFVAGIVLGFAKALGEFGATITFVANIPGETRTLSLAIFTAMQRAEGMNLVYALAAISIGLSFAAALLSEALTERFSRHRHLADRHR